MYYSLLLLFCWLIRSLTLFNIFFSAIMNLYSVDYKALKYFKLSNQNIGSKLEMDELILISLSFSLLL